MRLKAILSKIPPKTRLLLLAVIFLASTILTSYYFYSNQQLNQRNYLLARAKTTLEKELEKTTADFTALKETDQIKRNESLQEEISNIQKTYQSAVAAYEKILDLDKSAKKEKLDDGFAKTLKFLSEKNYASASSILTDLNKNLESETNKTAASFAIPENVPTNNQPPSSGFSKQQVQTDSGTFMVSIVSADLSSTRVIVDTASESDCANDCPVLSLGDYVGRNGAFAGINGSFFCPASYPTCTGKTNSFDTLLMNKNKTYFNSDNNVYSTVPAVIFYGNSARFVGQSLEWGRDTGADAVLANHPLLVSGGQSTFGGNGDPKLSGRGARTFIGATGSTVYIGIVYNATSEQAAKVLQTMGIQNALGLDQGGSTALWYGGYKAGPGRNIPNAILLIRK